MTPHNRTLTKLKAKQFISSREECATCHIDTDIMPLSLRRDKAVLEMTERYQIKEQNIPNHKIVINGKQATE